MGLDWNKVIDLYFLNESGAVIAALKCPRFGRKPSIELTGAMYSEYATNGFNISLKNFYLDNITSAAARIRTVAGYADSKHITLEGNIAYIHQESPAPEGTTVIQCSIDNTVKWLTTPVTLNLDKGYTLNDAVTRITSALKFRPPILSVKTAGLIGAESLQFQGSCQDALRKLGESFKGVHITHSDDRIFAYEDREEGANVVYDIPYLSSPPQITAGVGDALSSATITAPWAPQLKVNDIVRFNSACYQSTQFLKNFTAAQAVIRISHLQFHFATVGNVNQMVIYGLAVQL